jgi:simple sugar transport system permease protein
MSLFLGVSQVALGFVLSLLCRDLAYFLGNGYNRIQGVEVLPLPIPFLSDIPVIGPSFFNHNMVVYASVSAIFLLWFYTEKSGFGLHVKAAGENPYAAFARGGRPKMVRFVHVIAGGFMTGLSGAAFSLVVKAGWGRPQGCEGTGWIALALVIFGGWSFWRVAVGCYIFSFLQILGLFMQQWFQDIPAQVFQVAPFPLMIFSLALIHFSSKVSGQSLPDRGGAFRFVFSFVRALSKPAPAHLGKHFEP